MPQGAGTARSAAAAILAAEKAAREALGRAVPALGDLAEAYASTLRTGGRVAYLGAGTSGRLGALDAAELLPTFGIGRDRVTALVAGGRRALWTAVEGAEDDTTAARRAVGRWGAGPGDLVIGVSASGTTPWTVAGVEWAGRRGAATGSIVCAVDSPLAAASDHPVEAPVEEEWLAGSTRLASGGIQRSLLSALSTAAAAGLGAVTDGLMTRVVPTNAKLRRRAAGLVSRLGGVSSTEALEHLRAAGWRVEVAVLCARGLDPAAAARRLEESTLAEILAE